MLPWIAISTFYQRHVDLFDGLSMQPRRIAITPRLSTDSLHVARNTVLTGLGVAVVSSWTVRDIREGRLIHLLPEWRQLPVHLNCIRGPDITRHACDVSWR